jgi:hypothetical protein
MLVLFHLVRLVLVKGVVATLFTVVASAVVLVLVALFLVIHFFVFIVRLSRLLGIVIIFVDLVVFFIAHANL